VQAALREAGVALPERLESLPAPAPLVISGEARAALAGARFAQAQTDALRSAMPQASPAPQAPSLSRRAPAAASDEADVPRRVWRAIIQSLGVLVAVNLLGVTLAGALDRLPAFAGLAWPVEVLLVALMLSLLMAALANRWLAIPLAVVGNVGLLLAGYALSGAWGRWFWWPLLVLLTAAEAVWAVRWMPGGRSQRARQLGSAATLFYAALIVVDIALAAFGGR
jgi:hypothetical protein